MGQLSERNLWSGDFVLTGHPVEEIKREDLYNPEQLYFLLQDPPAITTPGWAPQCYGDLIPYVCAMGSEYIRLNRSLSSELFRDFLMSAALC